MNSEGVDDRALAVVTYNRCWDLLDRAERSEADNRELLTAAFTSRFHWLAVGGDMQAVVSDWMVSRAAGAAGFHDLAVHYALAAWDGVQSGEHPAWLRGSVLEGVARAYAGAGNRSLRDEYVALAWAELDQEDDVEDREAIADQLRSVPVVA